MLLSPLFLRGVGDAGGAWARVPDLEQKLGAPLGAWIRVAVARIATNLRASRKAPAGVAPDAPGERERDAARTAIRSVLPSLSDREANLLRLHYLEAASPAAIAGLYQVSART